METTAWDKLLAALASRDVETSVEGAKRLHAEATGSDVPRLVGLLNSDDFFTREAAAWPLAELVGPTVLPELFVAYQRGFDEGHDNDGFTAALLEIAALHPRETRAALLRIVDTAQEPVRGHAQWLLEFCEEGE
ncbi:MAG TPA: hypothetical protein VLK85_05590 [Ramlibacter sp.]|nr:hypothetical protein [Ramlibacter sp.]